MAQVQPGRYSVFGMRTIGIQYIALLAVLLVASACYHESSGAVADRPADDAASPPADTAGFPTGPSVLVPPAYDPPDDGVDSTGAYLPVNGKPTLVYLHAIW